MKTQTLTHLFAAVAACSLAACGGGDSGISPTSATTPAPAATTTPSSPAPAPAPATPTPAPTSPAPSPAPAATPSAPAPASSTSASGDCNYEGNIFSVAGNSAQMDNNIYASDGITVLISQQNKYQVKSDGSFRGETGLMELSTDNTSTYTSAAANGSLAGMTVGPTNVKSYSKLSGANVLTSGLVTTTTVLGFSFAATSYMTPPISWPAAPTLNTPYTSTYTVTTEATATTPGSTSTQTVTTTFLGVEQVSVAAGTFAACKTKTETVAGTSAATVSYSWSVASGRLKGHSLKSEDASGKKTMEAKVLLLNGN
jgi:hypothetical protein